MADGVDDSFQHLRMLAREIREKLHPESGEEPHFNNEVAGMFAVTIVATYEGIVKNALISYAAQFHEKYEAHVINDFSRLNARISVDDLYAYSRNFGLARSTAFGAKARDTTFHNLLAQNRALVERRFRKDMIGSYRNLFRWRNAYAHEKETSATFGDVYDSHRVAQYVIRSFVKAFEHG